MFVLAAAARNPELLSNVTHDWSAPEVNFPLTLENVNRFRAWFIGAEPYPAKPESFSDGNLVSIKETRKKSSFRNS